ncbi:hypothetical protein CH063_09926 [Colletotrichum higginsianum]|uniref:FAD binding domain-containing protein n=2 Tax=Colletotrichum higginsianum TaxID=80884 RepID=H1VFG6_COLHI|nr:FAD binding domain-containing protein [Colletotrichum higginsianum IMI 349063]OBR15646.1 FAD binding domain-containing protein [Colletotrichum higginsianum IMI 349063]TID04856.1 hypothetical protein CH35J_002566 [Colletotrichum higginsianum]CCF38969.1 hypothetical protein CH063_09926 [Colletotrichum higginsianum]
MSTKPVIFFAGGAWHSPEHFRDIRDELHRRGYETDAMAYPSVGAEPPTKGMHDDAAAVRTVLEELAGRGRRIVLVAHSYGGFVGAEAARGLGFEQRAHEGKAGGIVVFAYLAAFVGQKGQSMLGLTGDVYPPWTKVEDGRIHVVAPTEAFYGDVAPEARERAIGLLRHQTIVSFEQALTYEPWRDMPCMYVGCEDDGAVPFFMQEQMQQLLGPTAVKLRMKASHSPFLSRIAETADWIETAAGTGQEAVGA